MATITYQVRPEQEDGCCIGSASPDASRLYVPRVYLDTSVAMAKAAEIGEEVTVLLRGVVSGVQMRQNERNPASFDLELSSITLKTNDTPVELSDMVDAADIT